MTTGVRQRAAAGLVVAAVCLVAAAQAEARKAPAAKARTPALPAISVLDTADVGRHPLGVAIHSGRGQAVVANRNAGSVSVVDVASGAVVATVPVGNRPVDVAIHPATSLAVVSLENENAVALVSLNAFATLRKVGVGHRPAGVAVDPALGVAVVANQRSGTVTVVSLATSAALAEVRVGRRPTDVAINPLSHVAAVTNRGDGSITLLDLSDPASPTIPAVVALPGFRHDDHGSRARTRHDRAPRPRPVGVAFDHAPGLDRLVVADAGNDAVHVVTLGAGGVPAGVETVAVGKRPAAIAVNPGHDLALVTSDQDEVLAIGLSSLAPVGRARVGRHPRGVAIDPATCRAVVASRTSNTVSLLGVPCGPRITALEPPAVLVGSALALTIRGAGFLPGATVTVGGTAGLVPSSITAETITVALTAPPVAGPAAVSVTAAGRTSNAVDLQVVTTLPPSLAAVTPSPSVADGRALTIRLAGERFAAAARVLVAGREIPRAAVAGCAAPTCLAATLPGFDAAGTPLERAGLTLKGGVLPVVVENPDGARTSPRALVLLNPRPSLSTLVPNTATQGTEDKVITIFGEGFVADTSGPTPVAVSQVLFDGVPVPAVPFAENPTMQLFAVVPAAIMQVPGVYRVTVENPPVGVPPQGGGVSLAQPFTVTAAPASVSISTIATAGTPVNVVAWRDGGRVLAAAGLANEGRLQLLDVTAPTAPALVGAPLALAPPGFNTVADVAVNAVTRTLVVALPFAHRIAIVDVATPELPSVAFVDLAPGALPLGVAVDEARNLALVTNLGDLTAQVIDLATRTARPPIALPASAEGPVAAAVDSATGVGVVVDQRDVDTTGPSAVFLVDVTAGTVVGEVEVGGGASSVAVNPLTGRAVVTNQDDNTVSVVDVGSRAVTVTLPVGEQPAGVAIDPSTNRALVSSLQNNEITAIDLGTHALRSLFIGTIGVETPLDISWVPGPASGVAVCGALIGNNVTVLGIEAGALP